MKRLSVAFKVESPVQSMVYLPKVSRPLSPFPFPAERLGLFSSGQAPPCSFFPFFRRAFMNSALFSRKFFEQVIFSLCGGILLFVFLASEEGAEWISSVLSAITSSPVFRQTVSTATLFGVGAFGDGVMLCLPVFTKAALLIFVRWWMAFLEFLWDIGRCFHFSKHIGNDSWLAADVVELEIEMMVIEIC
jgi:hypothetical protein